MEYKTWAEETQRKSPNQADVVPSGILLKVKQDANGDIAKYRARLVVRGNYQTNGTDYAELYAPVACIELVRLMFAVSVAKTRSIEQLDVKGAFLHAKLPEAEEV